MLNPMSGWTREQILDAALSDWKNRGMLLSPADVQMPRMAADVKKRAIEQLDLLMQLMPLSKEWAAALAKHVREDKNSAETSRCLAVLFDHVRCLADWSLQKAKIDDLPKIRPGMDEARYIASKCCPWDGVAERLRGTPDLLIRALDELQQVMVEAASEKTWLAHESVRIAMTKTRARSLVTEMYWVVWG